MTALSILKGSATPTVTIHKQGERWTVAQRGDYPADVAKLRKLLLALSDAKIREEKTSNPANYSIIGVEDPTVPGASGAQMNLLAQDGAHGLIVGKTVAEGSFVRRAGEATSYIVEPGISFDTEPRYWIDTQADRCACRPDSKHHRKAGGGTRLHRAAHCRLRKASLPTAPPGLRVRPTKDLLWTRYRRGERRQTRNCWRPRPRLSAASVWTTWPRPPRSISASRRLRR